MANSHERSWNEIDKWHCNNDLSYVERNIKMAEKKWTISGYQFATQEDYEKAKKEGESVVYIKAHTDMTDKQQVLKVYNKAVDKKMFQTVIGYEFLHQLYAFILKNNVVEQEYIKNIPVRKQIEEKNLPEDVEKATALAEQYRVLYEDAKEKKKQSKIVNVSLALLIIIMIGMVYYNYNSYNEDAVIDKYATWEAELEEREAAVKEKEEAFSEQQVDNDEKEKNAKE